MGRSARLFLCARCRDQVLLCSHCDRGQQYCSRACSGLSRRERQRETAQRYQRSRRGRLKHAERAACWRGRRRFLRQQAARSEIDKVTHQGCPDMGAEVPLLACDTPSACETTIVADSATDTAIVADLATDTTPVLAGTAPWAAPRCRRCGHALLGHVRQGWLRPSVVRWRSNHDHPS